MRKIFVTGTHTGVGKTYATCQLLKKFHQEGLSTLGLKLISSGEIVQGVNEDARKIHAHASIKIPYAESNPYLFCDPIAPNIAAQQAGVSISVTQLNQHLKQITSSYYPDILILEGAGGWFTPLNPTETYADFVADNQLEVVVVIGIQLGCLNHAILTEKALASYDLTKVVGWIANCFDRSVPNQDSIINTLHDHLKTPCIGRLELDGEL